MLNSKIIDILKTFSLPELKKFSEFLYSPFHNKNKKAIQLFEILSKYHPDFDNKNLLKEKLFDRIYSDGNKKVVYNDASIRNLLSDLISLAEKFLAYVNLENDKFDLNKRILNELCNRRLSGVFEKRLKITEDLFVNNEFANEEEYYNKFILETLKSSSNQFFDNLKLYKSDYNVKASEYLTYFFLIKLFKSANFFEYQKMYNIYNSKNIAELIFTEKAVTELMELIKKNSPDNYLILNVFFLMYLALINPANEKYYFNYKENLFKHDNHFSLLEKYGLYICLTNSCVQKIDLGNEKFHKECFDIYQIMFRKDLFAAYPGFLTMNTFTAVIQTGLSSREFDKLEKFIYDYSGKLNPVFKEDAMNYSLAQLNFYKKNFGKSLEFISKTDTEFSHFKFHLKILSLKNYYELEDYDSMYYVSDSFTHFLNKNKIVGKNYKEDFSKFIRILDLLAKYRSGEDEKNLHKLKILIKSDPIAAKKWLKEKIEEIS